MAATNGTHPHVAGSDPTDVPQPESTTTNGSTSHAVEGLSEYFDMTTLSPSTQAIHADDPLNLLTDVAPPIHVSTTFRYDKDPLQLRPYYERPEPVFAAGEHIYSRHTTHSTSRFEKILSVLLKNPCLTYSSGLASFNALITFVNPKRVAIGAGYHGCHGVLRLQQRLSGLQLLPLDCKPQDLQEGDLIHLETPVNPTGLAFNIEHYAEIAHSRGAYLSVDATFAPPPLQDPFKHGADLVMHSGTKYIGGHSDLLCGVLAVNRKEWMPKLLEDRVVSWFRDGWARRLARCEEYTYTGVAGFETE